MNYVAVWYNYAYFHKVDKIASQDIILKLWEIHNTILGLKLTIQIVWYSFKIMIFVAKNKFCVLNV